MVPSKVYQGLHYKTGEPIEVVVENGTISHIASKTDINSLLWIGPGLVDLQVNGYKGIDFNSPSVTDGHILAITQELWREGVTSYLPTVITNSSDQIKGVLTVLGKALTESSVLASTMPGIHLEGPFISPHDGPRGAHPSAYIQAPSWELFQDWQDAARGQIRLITLSPEWSGSEQFIAKCVDSGVKVSIGHTAANHAQIMKAVQAGASMSTHLGNGAHSVLPRHPNYIWDQLAADELWASMIGDGFHLPASVLKVIYRTKRSRAMLISDSVDLAGMSPGEYTALVGGEVVLTPEGKLHLKSHPDLLAGSVRPLRSGIEKLYQERICSLYDAWNAASVVPSTYLNLATAKGMEIGSPADLVMFDDQDGNIEIRQTIKCGDLVSLERY